MLHGALQAPGPPARILTPMAAPTRSPHGSRPLRSPPQAHGQDPRRAARAGGRGARPEPAAPPAPVIEFRGVAKATTPATSASSRRRSPSRAASSSSSSARRAPGKSTLMRLLIKELDPTGGTIRVAGRDLAEITREARPVLPPQPRRGLPGLQAAAQPDRVRQRRLRAAGHRALAQGDPRQGAGHPAPDRPVDQAAQLPRPALRRRAAARLDRARVRQPPAAAAGRRADRQPRSRDVDRDHAAALPDQPHRHDRRRRHARPRDGRPHAPARDRARAGAASIRDEAAGFYAGDESTREFAARMRDGDPGPDADLPVSRAGKRRRAAHAREIDALPRSTTTDAVGFFLREALRSLRRNAVAVVRGDGHRARDDARARRLHPGRAGHHRRGQRRPRPLLSTST